MTDSELWRSHARELLGALNAKGLVKEKDLEDVYWAVPRHLYLDGFYEHHGGINPWQWQAAPPDPSNDSDWLARIYRDHPLVTRIDTRGMPTCSNSAPSLVFRMIAMLAVHPGERVVEIGTGTGQMAGLLGLIAGADGEVLTLDLDPDLAMTARERLAKFLPQARVTVRHADGGTWQDQGAEYHALMATASCWPVPAGWFASLAPGGRACLELRGNIDGALLLARRASRGSNEVAHGRFSAQRAGFMRLTSPDAYLTEGAATPFGFTEEGEEAGWAPAAGLGYRQLRQTGFGWYCQLELPDVEIAAFAVGPDRAYGWFLMADYGLDAVRLPQDGSEPDARLTSYGGTSGLLHRLVSAWQAWQDYERPDPDDYQLVVTSDGMQRVELSGTPKSWCLDAEF